MTQVLNADQFNTEVLQSEQPVLVDFFAEWCGPCKAIAPAIDQLAEDFQGRAKVVKVDIDANPEIASAYGVRSIPTITVFKSGSAQESLLGAQPKAAISGLLTNHLQ